MYDNILFTYNIVHYIIVGNDLACSFGFSWVFFCLKYRTPLGCITFVLLKKQWQFVEVGGTARATGRNLVFIQVNINYPWMWLYVSRPRGWLHTN